MTYKDQMGREYKQEVSNSDLVLFNEFYERLRIKEYSYQKKLLFMKKKELFVSLSKMMSQLQRQHSKNVNGFCG